MRAGSVTNVLFALGFALLFAFGCDSESPDPDDSGANEDSDENQDEVPDPAEVTVETSAGPVVGGLFDGARVFRGIPYAQAPERFSAPVAVQPWSTEFDATVAAEACAQAALGPSPASANEDCLHVDVWTPRGTAPEPLPVFVWFHGGGFTSGSTNDYVGSVIAKDGAVVVVASYRLGVLGFLAHPQMSGGAPAIRDQQFALEWVQANAAAFGGDPNNVTIAGQSAGATSVCMHMLSPASLGLFHRAIMQSGACQSLVLDREAAERQGTTFATSYGCDDVEGALDCLRDKAVEELLTPVPGAPRAAWGPYVDGELLPDVPGRLLERGEIAQVPVLFGTNKDEGGFFAFVRGLIGLAAEEYPVVVANDVGAENSQKILERYPLDDYESPTAAISAVLGDSLFNCTQQDEFALLAGPDASVSYFRYHFTQPIEAGFLSNLGTVHGAEMPYVFGNTVQNAYLLAEQDKALSATMRGYWLQFARTGDPNSADAPAWPPFTRTAQEFLELRSEPEPQAFLRESFCEVWRALE